MPLSERSTEVIRYLHERSGGRFPIIGVGGIMSPDDALEKLDAGASLVQVYTGFIYEGPAFVKSINKAILKFCVSVMKDLRIDMSLRRFFIIGAYCALRGVR